MQKSKMDRKIKPWSTEKLFDMVQFDFVDLVLFYRFGIFSLPLV